MLKGEISVGVGGDGLELVLLLADSLIHKDSCRKKGNCTISQSSQGNVPSGGHGERGLVTALPSVGLYLSTENALLSVLNKITQITSWHYWSTQPEQTPSFSWGPVRYQSRWPPFWLTIFIWYLINPEKNTKKVTEHQKLKNGSTLWTNQPEMGQAGEGNR